MTMPLSFTSSKYTGAEARRSLERTSVVSIITSWPIHASGIFPSNSEALGLSLSIIAPSSFRFPRSVRVEQNKGARRRQGEHEQRLSHGLAIADSLQERLRRPDISRKASLCNRIKVFPRWQPRSWRARRVPAPNGLGNRWKKP